MSLEKDASGLSVEYAILCAKKQPFLLSSAEVAERLQSFCWLLHTFKRSFDKLQASSSHGCA